jgi:tellurite resistance protein TerC
MSRELLFWGAFIFIYTVVFFIDMFATKQRKGEINVKIALKWTFLWIIVAILYGFAILFFYPQNTGSTVNTGNIMFMKFIAGYLTEYSLSIDNLFVFIMIFSLMGVKAYNQPKLLKIGILLSIALRILFILVGMELVERFHWLIYLFGVILLWTAYKMVFTDEDDQIDPKNNFLSKTASKIFPMDHDPDARQFFRIKNKKIFMTSLFLVFLVIGSTDVLFAFDSIPAIIGVIKEGATNVLTASEENFIAVTSNVFAVMGLVSLFFALKGVMKMFEYLKHGVGFILLFIALKMLFSWVPFVKSFFIHYSWVSLAVIALTLIFCIFISLIFKNGNEVLEED